MEKLLGLKVQKNVKVLGFDTASRTGWARARTDASRCFIDYGFIDVESKDLYYKYNQCINIFNSVVTDEDIVVIEETFYSKNVRVFQMLSRLGAFIYTLCQLKGIKHKYFLSAISARKKLGLPVHKKEIVHKAFLQKVPDIKIDDIDILDAIILAFCGLTKESELDI